MKKKDLLILSGIFLLGFILRFYKLGEIPAGFHVDEAAFGYNAYSVYLTGHDEYNSFLPLFFRFFDMWVPGLYTYLTIPFIAILGLNEFAVRLPTALFGVLLIPLIYFLARILTKNNTVALLTSLAITISPPHITLSRMQSEPLMTVFLILAGFYFLLLGNEQKKFKFHLVGFIFWFLALFSHYMARTFLPPFFILLLLYWWKNSFSQKKQLVVLFSLLIVVPAILITLFGGSSARLKQLSIFNHPETTLVLNEQIGEDAGTNPIIIKLFHNKITGYSQEFLKNYFSYFNYNFLFSDQAYPTREVIPKTGLLYLSNLMLLLFGSYFLLKKNLRLFLFLAGWIIITPLGPALAFDETPNIHRFLIATIPLLILVAYGLVFIVTEVKKNKVWIGLFFLVFLTVTSYEFSFYLHQYYIHQQKHRPWYRNYGFKELVNYINGVKNNYQKIYVSKAHGNAYILFLFYSKYDPRKYQQQGSLGNKDYQGFDNYVFIPEDCPLKVVRKDSLVIVEGDNRSLYVNRGECEIVPKHMKVIKSIIREDNTTLFNLIEYVE